MTSNARRITGPGLLLALLAALTALFLIWQPLGSPRAATAAPIPRDVLGNYGMTPVPRVLAFELHPPWSLATITVDTSPGQLADELPELEAIFRWDALNQRYESWGRGHPDPLQSLARLEAGDAVWLRVAAAAVLEQPWPSGPARVDLARGWNLVGWTTSAARPDSILATLSADGLTTFDSQTQTFAFFAPDLPSRDPPAISPGTPIWVRVATTVTRKLLPPLPGSIPDPAQSVWSSTLIASPDESRLYVVNTDPGTVTIVDGKLGEALVELSVGVEPRTVALDPRGDRLYVTNFADSTISVLDAGSGATLKVVDVSRSPYGVVASPDGQWLYVSDAGSAEILVFDTASLTLQQTIPVEDNPRGLAVSPTRNTLYVSHFLSGRVTFISLRTLEADVVIGTGLESSAAQFVALHPAGDRAYLPHSRSRVSNDNLQFDTTVAPLVSIVDLDEKLHVRRELLGLDAIDRPVGLPFAVDFSPDGDTLYVVNSSSNDLSVIDLEIGLGLEHVELGANPRGIVVTAGGTRAYVANALAYTISVVDLDKLEVIEEIPVSRSPLPPDVQRGKELFFSSDTPELARDQWISCAACHFEGLIDGRTWPFEDGPRNTPPILGLVNSAPFHWSGNRVDLFDFQATIENVQSGTGLSDEDNAALAAFLGFPEFEPSPNRTGDGGLTAAAARGQDLFFAQGCAVCHAGSAFTDGLMHDVGTGDIAVENRGLVFDTPSLLGLHDTTPYLHDGTASTLTHLLTTSNPDDRHGLTSTLDDDEVADLVAFLTSLP